MATSTCSDSNRVRVTRVDRAQTVSAAVGGAVVDATADRAAVSADTLAAGASAAWAATAVAGADVPTGSGATAGA
ncbi:MAG: hypothetical protein ACK5JG_12015, partial [Pseudomonadota bacterium]